MSNEIKIVIGSWGSYNECNERALGSEWLTLNDYDDWEEIAEELQKQGFVLDGIDEDCSFRASKTSSLPAVIGTARI